VSAIVLAYRDEPWLEQCVHALLSSRDVEVEVVLVDNGCSDGGTARLRDVPGVVHCGAGINLGFSGGCNLGASYATGEFIAFVNSDLLVSSEALTRLAKAAREPAVGIAAGSIRLAEEPELLNSSGNEIHFLGFSWVGGFREPASCNSRDSDIAGAMGALIVLRREVWDRLGGFDDHYFAFHEDAELSWRCWETGLRVRYVSGAIGLHRYEFGRVDEKLYLAERNRLIFVLTLWETRTVLVLAPALIAMELAVFVAALKGGWWRAKIKGWRWLIGHRKWLSQRRRRLQAERTVSDRDLAPLLTSHLDARNFPLPSALRPFDDLLAFYWLLACRFLR
jgi:GT2 family glycosyltransferase